MTPLRRALSTFLACLVVLAVATTLAPVAEAGAVPKRCANKHYAKAHPKACRKPPKPKPVWTPTDATTFNYPFAGRADQQAIRRQVLKAIEFAPAGSRIRLATFSYFDAKVGRALIRAHERGVSVQLIVNRHDLWSSRPYRKLQRELGFRRTPPHGVRSSQVSFARSCLRSCRGRSGNLHTKIFLFSQVGHARWVSMFGSANLSTKAVYGQWNHMDTLVDKATYVRLGMLFDQMKADRVPPRPIWTFSTPRTVAWAFPHQVVDPSRDPMVQVLRRITCRAPAHTGVAVHRKRVSTRKGHPKAGKKALRKAHAKPKPRPFTRRTVIRIGMYAWFDERGDYLAREVRRKWDEGCSVRVVYSVLNAKVKRILYSPTGRGRIPMRRVVRTDDTGTIVDYDHSKYVAMSGGYRHHPHEFVWTGSMNFTGLGVHSDDVVLRLKGHRVVTAYFRNFRRVWRSPKASKPIPTRPFAVVSRLAPAAVPDRSQGAGAGIAPQSDELEQPRLGAGELSGFELD